MIKTTKLALLLVYLTCFSPSASARQQLQIAALQGSAMLQPISEILQQAYMQLGIELQLVELPGMRGLHFAAAGKLDGAAFRLSIIEPRYPDLVRVDVPLYSFHLHVFVKQGEAFAVADWHSIPSHAVLCHVEGRYLIKKVLEKHQLKGNKSSDIETVFRKLSSGRCDMVIASREQSVIASRFANIIMLPQPVESHYFYHYLHSKHWAIAPQLEQVLQGMRDRGEMAPFFAIPASIP